MNANEAADLLDSRSVEGSQSREVAHLIRKQAAEIEVLKGNIEIHKEANRNTMESLMQSRVRIDQLLETQDYLYKRHDEQQADLKDADKYALELERLYEDAKAEKEALKKHNEGWKEDFIKQGIKLEKLKSELVIANAMLDSYEWCKK